MLARKSIINAETVNVLCKLNLGACASWALNKRIVILRSNSKNQIHSLLMKLKKKEDKGDMVIGG